MHLPDPRDVFAEMAWEFVAVVGAVDPAKLDGPGLGEWDLRSLIGHTWQGLVNAQTFLDCPADRVEIESAVDYFRTALESPSLHSDVAARGRQSGLELGDDPAEMVRSTAERVVAVVQAAPLDSVVMVGGLGGMRLGDYLPTRVVELVVHSDDISRASGQSWSPPPEALEMTLRLLTPMVSGQAGVTVARALLGRGSVDDINVFG